ncbi:GIY-YIG nuclease family protein [uncultured Shewanella sp.]|uniref:GIY-YIG nuclease family protein n=1 Tax=uncultured Shewanella sp. TaxID=173975 RepID=UPI00261ECD91|nr:GIY-YIG nuclease family protein [uncultured Shewanella sp.]
MTNIYLLIYPKLKAFKVGKADNVFNRADSIKKWWGEPDYANSFSLVISSESVFKLEKSLHLLLEQFSMNYSEGDGKTEFFSVDAFNDAIEYINVFIKSNKLTSALMKGVDKLNITTGRNISRNRDYIFTKHNVGNKRVIGSLNYSIKNMERVLRVNNLLIKYRKRIKFELTLENETYSLTLYNRKFLAGVLFENLRTKHEFFSGGFVSRNLSDSLSKDKDCYQLKFHLHTSFEDKLTLLIIKELECSFKLLQKASLR